MNQILFSTFRLAVSKVPEKVVYGIKLFRTADHLGVIQKRYIVIPQVKPQFSDLFTNYRNTLIMAPLWLLFVIFVDF